MKDHSLMQIVTLVLLANQPTYTVSERSVKSNMMNKPNKIGKHNLQKNTETPENHQGNSTNR